MATVKLTFILTDVGRIDSIEKKVRGIFPTERVRVEKVKVAESRADRLSEAEASFEDAKSVVEELKDEMQNWYDSIPENLQSANKADEVQEAINGLEEIASNLEQCDFSNVSFPGMF